VGAREEGFTLVGLMIAVLIINVMLGIAVTSWVTIDRRADEAELIWRGEQIVRGIRCYQQKNATEPLTRLEQLVEESCLRRVYRDPIAGEWRILRESDVADGTVAALLGQPLPGESDAGATGPGGPMSIGAQGASSAFGSGSAISRAFEQRRTAGGVSGLRLGASGSTGEAIVGVVSSSKRASLRLYRGKSTYGEWVFLGQETGPA